VVRDSGQNGPRWHPRLSQNTYHMTRTSGWYVFQDKPLNGTPRLSADPYHISVRGTGPGTNSSPAGVSPRTRTLTSTYAHVYASTYFSR